MLSYHLLRSNLKKSYDYLMGLDSLQNHPPVTPSVGFEKICLDVSQSTHQLKGRNLQYLEVKIDGTDIQKVRFNVKSQYYKANM